MIATLIDKYDSYELVRNQVALILANETVNQVALATAAGKTDLTPWQYTVYVERKDPLSLIEIDDEGNVLGDSSIMSVWLDRVDISSGTIADIQQGEAIINIDCVSSKASLEVAENIEASDKRSSLDAERLARLARNILMNPEYIRLQLNSIVLKRWITSIQKLFSDRTDRPYSHVVVSRVVLNVTANEDVNQIPTETLESIYIDIEKSDTGLVLPTVQIDTTT